MFNRLSVFMLAILASLVPVVSFAQSAADPATTALGDVATAGAAIGTAMVAGAAAILVGRWVTAFIAK